MSGNPPKPSILDISALVNLSLVVIHRFPYFIDVTVHFAEIALVLL